MAKLFDMPCPICRGDNVSSQPIPPPPLHKSNTGKYAVVAVVVVAIAAVVLLLGAGGIQQTLQSAMPPSVTVTSENIRSGWVGLDWAVWVDASVYNSGGKGTVTVAVTVDQGSNTWTKTQSVYLDAKGSKNLTFQFLEPAYSGVQVHYSVSVY